jgi:hypothetical protein
MKILKFMPKQFNRVPVDNSVSGKVNARIYLENPSLLKSAIM